jgi:hypothetical protein
MRNAQIAFGEIIADIIADLIAEMIAAMAAVVERWQLFGGTSLLEAAE